MAQNLNEYLCKHPSQGFKSVPHYFASGDFVTYYLRNDRCYAERVDDVLTVFLTHDSRELVGCKIKGVKHILETAGDFGVTVEEGPIHLGFFFMGAATAKDEEQKRRYDELKRLAKDATIDPKELALAHH